MAFAQKIEEIVFPCAKIVRELKVEHDQNLKDFKVAVDRLCVTLSSIDRIIVEQKK